MAIQAGTDAARMALLAAMKADLGQPIQVACLDTTAATIRGARLCFGTLIRAERWVLDLAGGGRGAWLGRARGEPRTAAGRRTGVVHSRQT